jgi:hypothetical protein
MELKFRYQITELLAPHMPQGLIRGWGRYNCIPHIPGERATDGRTYRGGADDGCSALWENPAIDNQHSCQSHITVSQASGLRKTCSILSLGWGVSVGK